MKDPKVVAIIQARMSSSRLPGKVLREINGKPMLAYVVERTGKANLVDHVLVATTDDQADDPLVDFCTAYGIEVYRGSQFDVLDRYYQAARETKGDVIVRVTADCPLIDPALVDETLRWFMDKTPGRWDFAANRLPPPWGRTYPIGLDVEVCSIKALEFAWKHAQKTHQREHVMPYLYEFSSVADSRRLEKYKPPVRLPYDLDPAPEQPEFRVLLMNYGEDHGNQRWTVDTPNDLDMVRTLFQYLPGDGEFGWLDVLEVMERHPDLAKINAEVKHKKLHDIDERAG